MSLNIGFDLADLDAVKVNWLAYRNLGPDFFVVEFGQVGDFHLFLLYYKRSYKLQSNKLLYFASETAIFYNILFICLIIY